VIEAYRGKRILDVKAANQASYGDVICTVVTAKDPEIKGKFKLEYIEHTTTFDNAPIKLKEMLTS
jgi:hypothetical protein